MARLFDGVDDNLSVASAVATAAPLTMAVWIRPTDVATAQAIFALDDGSLNNRFQLALRGDLAGDIVEATTNGGGGGSSAQTSVGVTSGVWAHVCGVFAAADDRRIFLNGGNKATNAVSRTPTGINTTVIGSRSGAAFFEGRGAEAAIWNVALTDAEVAALGKGVNPRLIRPGSLIFYAPLWGTSSPERDYTNGQRHLTVTGATVAAHSPTQPTPPSDLWVPGAGAAAITESGTSTSTVSHQTGSEALADVATNQETISQSGSEALAETGSDTIALTQSGLEALIDQGESTTTITPSGTSEVIEEVAPVSTGGAGALYAPKPRKRREKKRQDKREERKPEVKAEPLRELIPVPKQRPEPKPAPVKVRRRAKVVTSAGESIVYIDSPHAAAITDQGESAVSLTASGDGYVYGERIEDELALLALLL